MIRAVPLILLLLALGLAACGDDAPSTTMSGDLRYVRSGGFAGHIDELLVRPSGDAKVRSRSGEEKEFMLTDRELQALPAEAERFEGGVDQPAKPAPDAFVHAVEYEGRKLTTSDASGGGRAAIVAQLQKILEAHR